MQETIHAHSTWAITVLAAATVSGAALPAGVSQHKVGDWLLTINNSNAEQEGLPAWRIDGVCEDGDPHHADLPPELRDAGIAWGKTVTLEPQLIEFNCDEGEFLSAMQAALPDGHHLKNVELQRPH